MKILIDIGHPAHVHYFKNFICLMENKGHKFLIVARDKEVTHNLLNTYDLAYISRGKGRKSLLGKMLYTLKASYLIYKLAKKWQPQIFLSFGSPYTAQVSWLLNIPNIALTDTEHAKLGLLAFVPFSATILTPDCFYKDLGNKHIKFAGYFEMCYLLPPYYTYNDKFRKELGLTQNDKYVLFRYIAWEASHDIGQSGISDSVKLNLIDIFLKQGYKVFISSEGKLSDGFESYRIKIAPAKIHDVLCGADFFIGESGTMATEASILGTPSVYVNSLDAGVFQEEVKFGLMYSFRNSANLVNEIEELLKIQNLKLIHEDRKNKLLRNKIDTTEFLIWFVENYPQSFSVIKNSSDYQYSFKIMKPSYKR